MELESIRTEYSTATLELAGNIGILPREETAATELPDEARLAAGLRNGDALAFAGLYDAYSGLIYRLALNMVRDPQVAQDIVQETFVRAWERSHQIDEGAKLIGPWLLTIARNRAVDHLRSPEAKLVRADRQFDTMRAGAPSGEELAIGKQNVRRVSRAMSHLNDQQRQVIGLAYYLGLSQSEIAGQLGKPLGTIKSWTRTALAALRQELERKAESLERLV